MNRNRCSGSVNSRNNEIFHRRHLKLLDSSALESELAETRTEFRHVPGAKMAGQRRVVVGPEILAPRALPESLVAVARQYAGNSVAADAILPLAASGRNEPYAIEIASPEWRVLLIADPLNRVSVSEPLAR